MTEVQQNQTPDTPIATRTVTCKEAAPLLGLEGYAVIQMARTGALEATQDSRGTWHVAVPSIAAHLAREQKASEAVVTTDVRPWFEGICRAAEVSLDEIAERAGVDPSAATELDRWLLCQEVAGHLAQSPLT